MSIVFVDSGAWIALVKRNDLLHDAARRYYQRCVDERIGFDHHFEALGFTVVPH